MLIRFLGCHHTETAGTRLSSLVIDQRLVLDAGAITSTLTEDEQSKIEAILLTHQHLDHVRDVPTLALSGLGTGKTLPVFGTGETLNSVQTHLLNDQIYPDFTQLPNKEQPRLELIPLEVSRERAILGYQVTPIPTIHCEGSVGFFIQSPTGASCYCSGDTNGEGLASAWYSFRPDLVIVELTFPNSQNALAHHTRHLTPQLLQSQIEELQELSAGGLPEFVVTHFNTERESEIKDEIHLLSDQLGISVTPAEEGRILEV